MPGTYLRLCCVLWQMEPRFRTLAPGMLPDPWSGRCGDRHGVASGPSGAHPDSWTSIARLGVPRIWASVAI